MLQSTVLRIKKRSNPRPPEVTGIAPRCVGAQCKQPASALAAPENLYRSSLLPPPSSFLPRISPADAGTCGFCGYTPSESDCDRRPPTTNRRLLAAAFFTAAGPCFSFFAFPPSFFLSSFSPFGAKKGGPLHCRKEPSPFFCFSARAPLKTAVHHRADHARTLRFQRCRVTFSAACSAVWKTAVSVFAGVLFRPRQSAFAGAAASCRGA